MVNLWFVTCILATWAVVAVNSSQHQLISAPSPSPEPAEAMVAPTPAAVDCSSLIYNMADCLSFLSDGSDETTPDCCSGFKLVMNTDADCICEALKSSSNLGVELNMTKAMTLPSACGISAPSLSSCYVNPPPNSAPPPDSQNPPNSAPPPHSQNPPLGSAPPPDSQNPPPNSAPPPDSQDPPPATHTPPEAQNPPEEEPPAAASSPAASNIARGGSKSPAPSPASSGSSYTIPISFPLLFSVVFASLLSI